MPDVSVQPEVLALVGEEVLLQVAADAPVLGPVKVSFWAFGENSKIYRTFWDEALIAEEVAGEPPTRGQIRWRVTCDQTQNAPVEPTQVEFSVTQPANPGNRIRSVNHLRVPGFKITDNEKLRWIMVHEFPLAAGGNGPPAPLDDDPLKGVLNALTAEQRKLLAETVPGSSGHRLVCLVTLQPPNNLKIHADTCSRAAIGIRPNATFTVFDCQGPGKDVTLVCHTNYFLAAMANQATRSLLTGAQNGLAAQEWLSRSNPRPPQFKISASLDGDTNGVHYCQIFNGKRTKSGVATANTGKNVMCGNYVHGVINTEGCWMMFRNYNWPRREVDRLDDILIKMFRMGASAAQLKRKLAEAEYTAEETDMQASSLQKFYIYDLNNAYTWFFHDLVGVKYISKGWLRRIRGRPASEATLVPIVHRRNLHGLAFENTLLKSEMAAFAEENGDDAEKYTTYDPTIRQHAEPGFRITDDLFVPNALGFKTADGFVDVMKPALREAELDGRTWADVYFYRADNLVVKSMPGWYYT